MGGFHLQRSDYTIEQIDNRTWALTECIFNCLIYVLSGDAQALVIDTGCGIGELNKVVAELTGKPATVVNTHGHIDHISGNHFFSDIYLNKSDAEVLAVHMEATFAGKMLNRFLPAGLQEIYRHELRNLTAPKTAGNYHWIDDGHVFDLGGRRIEVVATPGHTPGSICLLDREARLLFSGDTVCARAVLLNLEYSLSPQTYRHSIGRLVASSNEFDRIYGGHHLHPIGTEYLRRYQECADGILDGTLPLAREEEDGTVSLVASFDDIRIALPGDYKNAK